MLTRFPDFSGTRTLFAFTLTVSWLALHGLAIGVLP